MTKYLHTMIRVSSLEDSIVFFEVLGLREIRRLRWTPFVRQPEPLLKV